MTLSLFPVAAPPLSPPRGMIGLGAGAAAGWFLLFQLVAYVTAGRFDYPFDDVYIHLSMASGIAEGYYGLNNGEVASAASSILYPFLLLPFPGTELQRLLPLFWNLIGVTASGALFGAACAYLTPRLGRFIACLAPLCLNLPGLGFGGMEHTLHLVTALLCLFGLWRWLNDGALTPWFIAALILGPMLRYEALALSFLSLGAMALTGLGWRRLFGLAVAVLAPLVAFSLFLLSQDLPPLPNSVRVKQVEAHLAQSGLQGVLQNIKGNFDYRTGPVFFLAAGLGLMVAYYGRSARAASLLLATASLALLAHMIVGRTGWMHRYETYAIFTFAAALLIAWEPCRAGASRRLPVSGLALLGLMMTLHGAYTLKYYPQRYLKGPLSIASQQGQMARLAHQHLKAPVGINDLGYVAWNNPYRVLDMWGLANRHALDLRRADAPYWASDLLEMEGVDFAMVYDSWMGGRLSPDWIRLGQYDYIAGYSTLGSNSVSFYAANAATAERLREAVLEWLPGLPQTVRFSFAPDWQP